MDFEKRTDLAIDSASFSGGKIKNEDYEIESYTSYGIECIRVEIKTQTGERICKRKMGTYITLVCGKIALYGEAPTENITNALCEAFGTIWKNSAEKSSFLIVGLGNRFITSDSLGPICIDKMGFKQECGGLYLLSPGVFSQSGIVTKELIKGTITATGATNLVLIDALATSSLDRLCSTIQISSTGLTPGSGTNSSREKISEEEIGVPIISIGVPTVVSLSGIFLDAIRECNVKKVPTCVYNLINEYSELLVSPNEIDAVISSASSIISEAIKLFIKKNPLQR